MYITSLLSAKSTAPSLFGESTFQCCRKINPQKRKINYFLSNQDRFDPKLNLAGLKAIPGASLVQTLVLVLPIAEQRLPPISKNNIFILYFS